MTGLSERVEEYLRLRRALGFKLERAGRLLDDFVAFADQAGERTVTVEVAVAWATRSPKASPVWVVQQLGMVRTFARWLQTLEPVTEVPPVDLLSAPVRRATPYVYSEAEIAALMTAARSLTDPLRAATFETLIGLLATTGLRVGEAMRLDRRDIDWTQRLLFVNNTKFGKSRQLPLHASTLDALADYANRRDQLLPSPVTASFFVSASGRQLSHSIVQPTFRRLLHRAGVGQRSTSSRPCIHALRHTFAVRTLLRWYRDGGDVQARLPRLSTYLGHVNPGATYWYLSAAPELLALATERLEAAVGESR